jgi:hypothetical protein
VSKRHQASRRRSYGRRQHELRERIEKTHPRDLAEFDLRRAEEEAADGFPFFDLDLGARRLGYAMGD